jgi:hypothetical protein
MKEIGNPLDMFDHAYAEMPQHLLEQKDYLTQTLSEENKE